MCFNHGMHVSVSEVLDLLRGQPNDKATGMDGLSGESLNVADIDDTEVIWIALLRHAGKNTGST